MTRYIIFILSVAIFCNVTFAQKIVGYRNSTSYCPMEISLANSTTLTHIPRFSPFWNVEQRSYYGWGKGTFSVFGSVSSHNLGVITQVVDTIMKHRVYASGLLGAVRIGFNNSAIFAGGGVDFPILYKSKRFENGIKKGKTRGYFSKEVNYILPHVFVGFDASLIEIKAQYYPTNFWGKNSPFPNVSTQMLNISVGFNRIWLENWLQKQKKDIEPKGEDDKDKPRRYPWDKNKENET